MRAMGTVRRRTPAAKCERGRKYRASLPFFAAVDIERALTFSNNYVGARGDRPRPDRPTRAGDDYAFRARVDRYEFQVAATVIGMLAPADHVGQEIFVRYYSGLGTYLTRIATNLSLSTRSSVGKRDAGASGAATTETTRHFSRVMERIIRPQDAMQREALRAHMDSILVDLEPLLTEEQVVRLELRQRRFGELMGPRRKERGGGG